MYGHDIPRLTKPFSRYMRKTPGHVSKSNWGQRQLPIPGVTLHPGHRVELARWAAAAARLVSGEACAAPAEDDHATLAPRRLIAGWAPATTRDLSRGFNMEAFSTRGAAA